MILIVKKQDDWSGKDMKLMQKRPAIAMIELIFAIVLMGIAMMSAPMLIDTATRSSTVALQQAAIHEAVSRVSMILTYEWDQNDTNTSCSAPVLHTVGGDSDLDMVATTSRRVGIPLDTNYHTFKCGSVEFNASSLLGKEGTVMDDIDDFISTIGLSDLNTSGSGGKDYIETDTVSIDTNIYYSTDAANYAASSVNFDFDPANTLANSTSIKTIQVTITSTSAYEELQKEVVLSAFSCNIGGYGFEYRTF